MIFSQQQGVCASCNRPAIAQDVSRDGIAEKIKGLMAFSIVVIKTKKTLFRLFNENGNTYGSCNVVLEWIRYIYYLSNPLTVFKEMITNEEMKSVI